MDQGKEKAEQHGHGDEFRPSWPRRPDTGELRMSRPRLDPPLAPGNSAGPSDATSDSDAGSPGTPTRWTSHPTSHNPQGYSIDDPQSTRVLPVVEGPSRFDKGGQSPPGPQTPAQARAQVAPTRQPAGDPDPQAPQPSQPRRASDWQYERDEDNYDGYGDRTLPYLPQQRPAKASQIRQAAAPRVYPKGNADPTRSYLSVEIDGVKQKRGGAWIFWLLGGVISIALIAGAAFALAWQGQYIGKMYAGVSVLGIDMSGKTREEALQMVNDKIKAFSTEPVVLTWNNKEWRPSLDDLGVKVSVNTTLDQAYSVGRGSDFFGNVEQQWSAAQNGYVVPLTVQLSEPALKDYLEGIAKTDINQSLSEGDIRLNGNQIEAMPGVEGRSLNVYSTIDAIRTSVAKLEPSKKINLTVDVIQPTVSADEVNAVKNLLTVRLSSPITATTLTGTFTIDQQQLINFTTIERNPDRTAKEHVRLGWKENELKILGDKWAGQASVNPRDAKFTWNNGTLAVKTESIDGFQTNSPSIIKAIEDSADSPDKRTFAIPGKVLTATISSKDLPALGITDLMGSGTSTFVGSSQERATNIRVAGQLLDGTVVPPGGTFSFLQTMGGIDEAHGFVQGYVIAAERTQLGVGGGVCQVSTTMFRAAFWSGMDITERNQHSYRVSWYEANGEPVGFDAAVFDPGVDMKFVNTTQHYILIQTVLEPSAITLNIYGTRLPGQVKLEGPVISNRLPAPADVYEVDPRLPPGTRKQVETAHAGLTTVVTRRIQTAGQPDKVDTFKSTYQPWPNWFIVASAAQIPSGSQVAPNPTPNP